MNLARIMIPKVSTVFLKENQSVRQGWEIMNRNGYIGCRYIRCETRLFQQFLGCTHLYFQCRACV